MSRCSDPTGRNLRGFTLIEVAIVLLIVGVLLGGLLVPLASQMEARKLAEARQSLTDIREALLGFALAQGRLPCPAAPAIPSGSIGAGSEDCSRTEGSLPWALLGLPETDAWGRRYTYRVTDSFKDAIASATTTPPPTCTTPATLASFALCSEGDITIRSGSAVVASRVPAIVLSHGRNGLGAWLPSGSQVAGGSGDELENADADDSFADRAASTDFDDVVAWMPLGILLNRMVSVGKLP